jgi:hypothetical protein
LDIDIAFGYENLDAKTIEKDSKVKTVLDQIKTKYSAVIKSYNLESVEVLELKSGKLNYKITYVNPDNHLSQKFVVYFDPTISKVLVLNSISIPGNSQFEELSKE